MWKLKQQLLDNFYVPCRKHSPETSDGNNQASGMEPICNWFLQCVDQLLKTHLYKKGFRVRTKSSLHDLTHDLTRTRNGKFCCCLYHSNYRGLGIFVLCMYAAKEAALPPIIYHLTDVVQNQLIQPISETNSPDKVLFTYFEQVDKLAPKQKAVFQNHSSKKSRYSDFRDCGLTVVLLPAVSVFQGALSGFQLCNNIRPISMSSKKLFQPQT